jgi:hypothetical protein
MNDREMLDRLVELGLGIVEGEDCPPGHIYFKARAGDGEALAAALDLTYKPRKMWKLGQGGEPPEEVKK